MEASPWLGHSGIEAGAGAAAAGEGEEVKAVFVAFAAVVVVVAFKGACEGEAAPSGASSDEGSGASCDRATGAFTAAESSSRRESSARREKKKRGGAGRWGRRRREAAELLLLLCIAAFSRGCLPVFSRTYSSSADYFEEDPERRRAERARGLQSRSTKALMRPFFCGGCFGFFHRANFFFRFFLSSAQPFRLFFRTKNRCLEGERETRPADLEHGQKEMPQLPLAGVVAMLASANSTADEEAARARLQEKLADADARVVARSSSRVSHAVVLLPPGASSSASALKQCITQDELRGLHGRLAGVRV